MSSSIESMPKRWRSGVKVICVHSSSFLFSVTLGVPFLLKFFVKTCFPLLTVGTVCRLDD